MHGKQSLLNNMKTKITRNKKQGVEFKEVTIDEGMIWERPKKSTKAGQRERHVLIMPNDGQTKFELKAIFEGDAVRSSEVIHRSNNSTLSSGTYGSRTSTLGISRVTYTTSIPSGVNFFSINLRREKKYRVL